MEKGYQLSCQGQDRSSSYDEETLPHKLHGVNKDTKGVSNPANFKGGQRQSRSISISQAQEDKLQIDELPAFFGPMYLKDSHPPCVSCGSVLKVQKIQLCSRCGIPVCNTICEQNPVHANNECKIFGKGKRRILLDENNQCLNPFALSMSILMIRGASLKEHNPKVYEELTQLPSGLDYNLSFDGVVDWLSKSVLDWLKDVIAPAPLPFEDEVCSTIFKIVRLSSLSLSETTDLIDCATNYNLRYPSSIQHRAYALYIKASRLNHASVANTTWQILPQLGYKIRINVGSSVTKKDPEVVTCSQSQLLQDSVIEPERTVCNDSGVNCKSVRCADSTESEMYSSGVACLSLGCREKGGAIGYYLPLDPADKNPDSLWQCFKCQDKRKQSLILSIVYEIKEALSEAIEAIEDPLERVKFVNAAVRDLAGKELHLFHWLLFQTVTNAMKLFPDIPVRTKKVLNEQISSLEYLLFWVDHTYPGLSRQKASILKLIVDTKEKKMEMALSVPSPNVKELVPDLISYMEMGAEAFKYFMNSDLNRPGEDFSVEGKLLFDSIKKVLSLWKQLYKEDLRKFSSLSDLKPFLNCLERSNTPQELRYSLKTQLVFMNTGIMSCH